MSAASGRHIVLSPAVVRFFRSVIEDCPPQCIQLAYVVSRLLAHFAYKTQTNLEPVIFELREECNRLRQQLHEFTAPKSASKIVSLQSLKANTLQTKTQTDDIPPDILESIKKLGIKPGARLLREISNHSPQKVRSAIAAFEQYRSKTVVDSPGGCLLRMIQDEAEPNLPQEPENSNEREFDEWYAEAIRQGFVLDFPKNHLCVVMGEIQVKVKDSNATSRLRREFAYP